MEPEPEPYDGVMIKTPITMNGRPIVWQWSFTLLNPSCTELVWKDCDGLESAVLETLYTSKVAKLVSYTKRHPAPEEETGVMDFTTLMHYNVKDKQERVFRRILCLTPGV
jgi:hypothetical protein